MKNRTLKKKGKKKNETNEYHPSFGVLEICKVTCNPNINLNGSSIKHNSFYSLKVFGAHRYEMMEGIGHRFHAEGLIIEIALSANQLVDMLTHMNTTGIPCTLLWTREGGSLPEPPEVHLRAKMHNDIKKDIEKQGGRIIELVNEVDELLASKKTLNKAQRERMQFLTLKIKQYYKGNAAWLHKIQEEQLEKIITQVGCEVESTVSSIIRATGVKGLEKLIAKPKVVLLEE